MDPFGGATCLGAAPLMPPRAQEVDVHPRHYRALAALSLLAGSVAAMGSALAGCGPATEEPLFVRPPSQAPQPGPSPSSVGVASAEPASPVPDAPSAPEPDPAPKPPEPCPEDMAFVDTEHCPEAHIRCIRAERERSNKLTICHEFAPGQRCPGGHRRQRFCIDRYEYPNVEGAHPPTMVSAYDAAALCAERGKRLCWESEWTAACEGPDKLPFPYGHERSSKMCRIDQPWRKPSLDKVHSTKEHVRDPELRRLDQSLPSGAMPTCQSGFGVFDLTGNHDEWVLTEQRRGTSEWTGLKGGHWQHVRNACRPITTSHAAHWSYYLISFRCCRDPEPAALEPATTDDGGPRLWSPPPAPTPAHPRGARFSRGWTP